MIREATHRRYSVASPNFKSDGCPAYCPKLGEEGALVIRLEDRYSYWYQQINRFS